ncbi:MAG: hypothetical protein OEV42_12960 [Deltaproteobacteria bacterium]|nr:hypothetical protein [Deltaproteobacteria bacterium]
MNIKKVIIVVTAVAFLAASPLASLAETRVYTSISVAGVIGGGVYWYFSAGTRLSKRDRDHGYALLSGRKMQLQPKTGHEENSADNLTFYLPLYSIKF